MQLYVPVLGKHRKRSTRTTDAQKARRALARWKAELLGGTCLPDADRTTFADLAAMLRSDYVANGRKSLARIEQAIVHLTPVFGHLRARAISTDRVIAYVKARLEENAAPATINRELGALMRMFSLGRQVGKVGVAPYIRRLEERNARQGFFERDAFDAVRRHLPPDLQPVVHVAYLTGWRVASEILTRQWHHVDLKHGWLRLDPGETKNGDGRQFPLTRSSAASSRRSGRTPIRSSASRDASFRGSSTGTASGFDPCAGRGTVRAAPRASPGACSTTSEGRPSGTSNGPASPARPP
jgi:integrase